MNRTVAAAVTCLIALLCAAGAAQAASVGSARFALDSAASFPNTTLTAGRQQVVVLQSWQTTTLRALKAANPNVKVLMYKDASGACSTASSSGRIACGVSYSQAQANNWLLLNTSGSTFAFKDFPSVYAADIGQQAYQDAWATNVLAELNADPWDGVFMDDVNPTIRYHYDVTSVAKYPSDSAYQAATRSMLARVGPRIQAAGKLAIANYGSWSGFPTVIKDWMQFTSGGLDEQFLKWGTDPSTGYASPGTWATQLQEIKDTEAAGKLFIGTIHSSSTDERAARYGYATALLAGNGHTLFDLAADYTNETWFPEYDLPIGDPSGAESADANGVHRRVFSNGLALVNPTTSTQTVNLGGSYTGSGLTGATTATMPPQTGLVLVRDGSLPILSTTTSSTGTTSTTTTSTSTTSTSTTGTTTTSTGTTSGTTTTTKKNGRKAVATTAILRKAVVRNGRVRVSVRCTARTHACVSRLTLRQDAATARTVGAHAATLASLKVRLRPGQHRTVSLRLRRNALPHGHAIVRVGQRSLHGVPLQLPARLALTTVV